MKKLIIQKSRINGSGLFTSESIKKGEVVGYVHGPTKLFKAFTPESSKQTLNWIGASRYTWIDTTNSPFSFINHSCEPNVAIVTKRKVVAMKNITAGEELVMDYSFSEPGPDWEISCNCKSKDCRKKIGPINTVPKNIFKRYEHYIAKTFRDIYVRDVIHRKAKG